MAINWSPATSPQTSPVIERLTSVKTLYEFDEPLIFVAASEPFPLLCYKIGFEGRHSQYVLAPTNDAIVKRLIEGNQSLRSAIVQPWVWVAETDDQSTVTKSWLVSGDNLPSDLLPTPGYGLFPEHGIIRDSDAASAASFFSIHFRGGATKNRTIPISVLKTYVDAAYTSIWNLFGGPLVDFADDVSEKVLRKALIVPAHEPSLGSLLISVDKPHLDFSEVKTPPKIDMKAAQKLVESAHQDFLNSAQAISVAVNSNKITAGLARSHKPAMEVVTNLIPTSFFESVEISGRRASQSVSLRIDALAGQQLKEAYQEALNTNVKIRGKVIEINTSSGSFIIERSRADNPVTCVATLDNIRKQIFDLTTKDSVRVSGLFERRKRRDKLYIDHLEVE